MILMPNAWTDDFYPGGGYRGTLATYRREVTPKSGSPIVSYGTTGHYDNLALRYSKSRNFFRTVNGVRFRNPSTYKRMIASIEHKECDITVVTPTSTTNITGFPVETRSRMSDLMTYPISNLFSPLSTDEENRVVTECLNKLGDAKASFGASLAESVQTVDMLALSAKKLWEALLLVKKGKIPPWGRDLNTIPQGWLQFQYGWKPLVSDLKSLYDVAGNGIARGGLLLSASRTYSNKFSSEDDTQYWVDRRQSVKITGNCKLWAQVKNENLDALARVGLENPLTVGWELIPFSFVVDWGLPIGNFLQAASATVGLEFVGGFKARYAEGSVSGSIPQGGTGTRQSVEIDFKSMDRRQLTQFPRPILYAKSPFSTSHVTSALALWSQLGGARRSPRN